MMQASGKERLNSFGVIDNQKATATYKSHRDGFPKPRSFDTASRARVAEHGRRNLEVSRTSQQSSWRRGCCWGCYGSRGPRGAVKRLGRCLQSHPFSFQQDSVLSMGLQPRARLVRSLQSVPLGDMKGSFTSSGAGRQLAKLPPNSVVRQSSVVSSTVQPTVFSLSKRSFRCSCLSERRTM